MANISKLNINNFDYDIKDASAREDINTLKSDITNILCGIRFGFDEEGNPGYYNGDSNELSLFKNQDDLDAAYNEGYNAANFNGTIKIVGTLSASGTGTYWYSSTPPRATTSTSSTVTINIKIKDGKYSTHTISGNSASKYTEAAAKYSPEGSFVPAVQASASFSISSITLIPD